MAKVTGIDIYKLLPKTNCGDCNFPTCMAFAMQVAAKKAALDQCPHVSDEAQSALGDAQAPPMRTVTIGVGETALSIGGETVLFRHEEKFHHPTGVAIRVSDSLSDDEIDGRLDAVANLRFIRVGEEIGVDLVAVECESGDADRYGAAVKRVAEKTALPLVLLCEDGAVLGASIDGLAERRPLVGPTTEGNWEAIAAIAAEKKLPILVRSGSLDGLADLTEKLKGKGIEDVVLQPDAGSLVDALTQLAQLRRLALEKVFRPLGYPTCVAAVGESTSAQSLAAEAGVCRYAGIVITDAATPEEILPILTARQNIYTDPTVPNAIEAKLYEIGSPGADAPVILTTNFALTYFTVAGEVENSKVPAYITVIDTEGLGVLNAYADDKLTGEGIVKAVTEQGGMDRVSHNKLIIPGLVAVLRMEIQEESGWEVIVGPEDAAGIPHFLRTEWGG